MSGQPGPELASVQCKSPYSPLAWGSPKDAASAVDNETLILLHSQKIERQRQRWGVMNIVL